MRKVLLASAVAVAMFAQVAPAEANHTAGAVHFTLHAEVPCMVICSYWVQNGFTPCEQPFPPGSWADKITPAATTPPAGKLQVLTFEIFPLLDWDSFICANTAARTELAAGAYAVGDPCDGIIGPNDPTGTGCAESATIPTEPGKSYILRGYNWQDLPDCPASYVFRNI